MTQLRRNVGGGVLVALAVACCPLVVGFARAADDVIESLRSLKFVAVVDGGQPEARLWDAANDAKIRLKLAPGFDRFPLIQSGKRRLVIGGVVQQIDARQVIFRVVLNAATSKVAAESNVAPARLYKDEEAIYHIHKNHLTDLVEAKKVTTDEADRLFVIHSAYWDQLLKDRVAATTGGGRGFVFYLELVRGDIVEREGELVVLRAAEKYCLDPGTPGGGKARWHEGFCVLHLGAEVQDALLESLPEAQVKELLKVRPKS